MMRVMAPSDGRYHHGNLRAELLALAEVKLAENGVLGLSLRELARELGVSHGAPRQHFPDRQALLDALAEQGLARLGHELDAALGGAQGDFADRLVVFATAYVRFATGHPALLELMFTRKERPAATALRAAADRTFAAPSALIAEATEAGEIDGTDPDRVAMAVLVTLQGLAAVVAGDMIADRSVDSVVSATIQTLVRGLRPAAGRGS
jgi:AcrR family transcriptional regulator